MNHSSGIFTAEEVLASEFGLSISTNAKNRARNGFLREAVRALVEEGIIVPLSTSVFARSDVENEVLEAKRAELANDIEQSMDDDPTYRLITDLPDSSGAKRRVLDKRFVRQRRKNPLHQDNSKGKGSSAVYVAGDTMGIYLNEAGRYPLLTPEGEKYLLKLLNRVEDYDVSEWIRETLFKTNMRLVVSIAKTFPPTGSMTTIDLIAEGNTGLMHAIDLFEPEKGFKLSTYATFWIKQAIGRAIDQQSFAVRAPSEKVADVRSYSRVLLENDLNWDADPDILCRVLGIDEEKLKDIKEVQVLLSHASLNKHIGEDGEAELGDLVAYTTDSYDGVELLDPNELLERYSGRLDIRELQMLRMRFTRRDNGSSSLKSYREVGEAFGVTGEAARKAVARALALMKDEATYANVNLGDYFPTEN